MRHRKLGRTEIEVSELAVGTWGLSGDAYGPVSEREQAAVIERALSLGITLFDTADVYGAGAMERLLGRLVPPRGPAVIVTKVGTDLSQKPHRKRFDIDYLKEALERSATRLRRDQLDVVLLHNPSHRVLDDGAALQLLQEWVDAGRIRAWGISAGSPRVIQFSLDAPVRPQVLELAYNVFFSQDLHAIMPKLHARGTGILARSVLAHGLLAGFWTPDQRFADDDHRSQRWTPDQLRRRVNQLKALQVLNKARSPSLRAGAVHFVLNNACVSSAVLGPRSVLQLDQLVREVAKEPPYLEPDERARLTQRLSDFGVPRVH